MKSTCCVLAISFCIMILGCNISLLSGIPLAWKPTGKTNREDAKSFATFPGVRFKVFPFTDSRDNKAEIASNIEGDVPRIATTKDDVARWCTERFSDSLKLYGFNLVDIGETVQLHGEVIGFHVVEDTMYHGTVIFKITAMSPNNKILWHGLVSGSVERFGHSYNQEDYYETLSDSFLATVQSLIKDDGFVKAIRAVK